MARVHSFFIPDIEYLQDVQGLVLYLVEKVRACDEVLYNMSQVWVCLYAHKSQHRRVCQKAQPCHAVLSRDVVGRWALQVHIANMCLFCNRTFDSSEATQQHMADKGHTMIKYDTVGAGWWGAIPCIHARW